MPARLGLDEYLTVKTAAEFLGVSPSTLRNWDRAGKLKPHRHPMNRYRLYRRDELEAVLRSAARRGRDDG
jgi:MerR family transcriptional regulator, copper efflux regulator